MKGVRVLEKFFIPRRAFRAEKRPDLPMIRWIKKGAEVDPALLTPENVRALEEALWGTYVDEEVLRGVHIYQFYRVTSATCHWLFRRTKCLHVRVTGDELNCRICLPYCLGDSFWQND
jgi:hypothetical protein